MVVEQTMPEVEMTASKAVAHKHVMSFLVTKPDPTFGGKYDFYLIISFSLTKMVPDSRKSLNNVPFLSVSGCMWRSATTFISALRQGCETSGSMSDVGKISRVNMSHPCYQKQSSSR